MNMLDLVGQTVAIVAYDGMPAWVSAEVGKTGTIKGVRYYPTETWVTVEVDCPQNTRYTKFSFTFPDYGLRLRVRAGSRQITAWECLRDHAYNSAQGPMPDQRAAAAKRNDFWREASRTINRRVPRRPSHYSL